MAGHKNVGSVFARKPRRGEAHGCAEHKKENPALRGLCRLFADILDLLAILAAVQRIPVAKVRFLRDVHGRQISYPPTEGIVAMGCTLCKQWLTRR